MADDQKTTGVEFGPNEQQLLKNTESTVHSVLEDVKDIGDTIDHSKITLEQLSKDFYKFRRDHEQFRLEQRKNFAQEIAKQLQPLTQKLEELVIKKSRIMYEKKTTPFIISIFKLPHVIIKKTWHLIRH